MGPVGAVGRALQGTSSFYSAAGGVIGVENLVALLKLEEVPASHQGLWVAVACWSGDRTVAGGWAGARRGVAGEALGSLAHSN